MKKLSLKSFWSITIVALAVLILWGVGTKLIQSAYAAGTCTDFGGVVICADGDQCTTAWCLCFGTPINSWDFCASIPPCVFNGTPFLSGQITTGYKFIQFGSLQDAGNYQVMTCYGSAWRSPAIGATYTYSPYTVTPPSGVYCPDFGGVAICADTNRCNNAAWCSCQWATTSYTNQCHFSCTASTQTINTHVYTIPAIWYWSSAVATTGISIANGTLNYTQSFTCSAGTLSATGSESSWAACNASYTRNWTACVYAWGGGWGWGGGGFWTPTCTSANLMCTNNVRVLKTWANCQWGNLGHACIVWSGWNIWTWTLPVGSIIGSHYSTELNTAYLRAYAHSITTMSTIQNADMNGKLLRSHMAKMISVFAIMLGNLTPDTSKTCIFNDVANQSLDMRFYIQLSCQLGLMGVDITSFSPNQEVTRAQFGTIISRVIRWTGPNGWTPYYIAHLNVLKLAGIMNDISNPSMKEIRWYVMLMMKRTYELWLLSD